MSSMVSPQPGTASAPEGGQQPADVLVIFGITGDLAKVMTFRSLYRLQRSGLLDCPLVGVGVDDWPTHRLAAPGRRRLPPPRTPPPPRRPGARTDGRHRRAARRGGLPPLRGPPLVRLRR